MQKVFFLILIASLFGCQPSVPTRDKYARIKLGMPQEEAFSIMGGSGEKQTFKGQPPTEQTYIWNDNQSNYKVVITFANNKVVMHYDQCDNKICE